jgi:long-subunit acyl-CoA synthetase (AMP-forming)
MMLINKLTQFDPLKNEAYLMDEHISIGATQFTSIINDFKQLMNSSGIGSMSHVALIHEYNVHWLAAFIALAHVGAVIIPIDNSLSKEEIKQSSLNI